MYNRQGRRGMLKTGHYLGLKFSEGWFFAEILETEYVELKPWVFLNSNGNAAAIPAKTAGSDQDNILNSNGNTLVQPHDNEKNLIFQTRLGTDPSRAQIFPFFGRNRAPSLENLDKPGEAMVPVDGYESPYNDPTDAMEFFNVANMPDLYYQAYNPMDEATKVKGRFQINKMKYAAVTDQSLMKAMIEGQQPAKLYTMGLGVQTNDQLRIPGWMNEMFGSNIHTTREILNFSPSGGSSSSSSPVSNIPRAGSSGGKS